MCAPSQGCDVLAADVSCSPQLWLDVDRPIVMSPRRDRGGRAPNVDRPILAQMELRMSLPPEGPPVTKPVERQVQPTPAPAAEIEPLAPPSFGEWLLDQTGARRGSLADLAKAAKLDRSFTRKGTAHDVRARFSAVGADGDAFEALEDAELEYERQCFP